MQTSAWNSNMCVFIYSNVRFVALHVYFYYCCNMSAKITALLSKSLMNIECWDENNFLDLSWHEAHERVQGERQICVINTKSNLGIQGLDVTLSVSHALRIQFSALHGDDFIKISTAIKPKSSKALAIRPHFTTLKSYLSVWPMRSQEISDYTYSSCLSR